MYVSCNCSTGGMHNLHRCVDANIQGRTATAAASTANVDYPRPNYYYFYIKNSHGLCACLLSYTWHHKFQRHFKYCLISDAFD